MEKTNKHGDVRGMRNGSNNFVTLYVINIAFCRYLRFGVYRIVSGLNVTARVAACLR